MTTQPPRAPEGTSTASHAPRAHAGAKRPARFGERPEAAAALRVLAARYERLITRPDTLIRLDLGLTQHAGRPTPLVHARRLSRRTGGAQIYLKAEYAVAQDAHLQIVICGQALLAQMMGYPRLVTGTREGRRGLATASIAARCGMQATVYIDKHQAQRQTARLQQMQLMGGDVRILDARRLRGGDIREAALADWLEHDEQTFLVMGLDGGPPPYPRIIRDLISVIGREARRQLQSAIGHAPAALVARGGETADALGFFPPFLMDSDIRMVCVDPPPLAKPTPRNRDQYDPFSAQLSERQEQLARVIMEGLEYPRVTREHRELDAQGRIEHVTGDLADAEASVSDLARLEGIIVPLEAASTVAWARGLASGLPSDRALMVNLAQRGGWHFFEPEQLARILASQVR